MASPMGPIVVDCGTPLSLGGLPGPQVRKNLFLNVLSRINLFWG